MVLGMPFGLDSCASGTKKLIALTRRNTWKTKKLFTGFVLGKRMPRPLVSVLLPNLNNVRYLPERLETIYSQSCRDWELIIVDNYSDDGAWELFQQHAQRDSRIRLSQAPRAGMYANWNNCLEKARGDYIYIATSDDTMAPECLERLIAALTQHPEASLAQCGLGIIDPDGNTISGSRSWENYTLGRYHKDLVLRANLRLAPHDGLMHPPLFTVCTSITQLLIKKEVFENLGNFETRWGSVADFEWQMRAALTYNCIFIPEKLATWRIHPEQATDKLPQLEISTRMLEMAKCAFAKTKVTTPQVLDSIDTQDFLRFLELDVIEYGWRTSPTNLNGFAHLGRSVFRLRKAFLDWIWLKINRKEWSLWDCQERTLRLNRLLEKYRVNKPLFVD